MINPGASSFAFLRSGGCEDDSRSAALQVLISRMETFVYDQSIAF